jgi:hypothetical protein
MSDIHYLLSQAMTDRGHSFEICWQAPNTEYVLSVEASSRGGDANWKMFGSLSKEAQPLWMYVSCDVLLVHNLVKSTAGEGGAAEGAAVSSHNIETMVRRDVIASETKKKSKAFSGDLSLVQMPTLIQSILMAKMTGVLDVEDPDGRGLSQVFFVDGAAVHCVASDSYGEEGVLELLSWKEGNFHFEPNKTNEVRTIKAPLDSLLLKGMTIIDNAQFVSNLGVTTDSHLVRSHGDLTDAELEERTKKGAPVNMQKQKQLYRLIEPDTTLGKILDKLKWPRSQWVPILANLMRTELVTVVSDTTSPKEPQIVLMEPKRVDKELIQNVMMTLRSQETGLFTYAAFLYFLEQEYFRAYRSSNPMSVVIFQMGVKGPEPAAPREPLPLSALCAAVRRISSAKRHVDLLAHYESYDYVALLPNTAGSGAKVFATRVLKVLTQEPLIPPSNPPFTFTATFGIASIPEDFTELSHLLAAAEIAKTEASNGTEPIVLFKDIKQRYAFPGTPPPT